MVLSSSSLVNAWTDCHSPGSARAAPVYVMVCGGRPRTLAGAPLTARMMSPTLICSSCRARLNPPSVPGRLLSSSARRRSARIEGR